MKDNGINKNVMVKENKFGMMVAFMKDIGSITWLMVQAD